MRKIVGNGLGTSLDRILEHPPCCDRSKLDRALFQEKTLRFGRCFRDMPRSPHWRSPTRFRPRQSELSCAASRIVSLLGLAVALTCLLGQEFVDSINQPIVQK